MKLKKTKNLKGFSLVETLIAIFIFSIAATLLSSSFASFLKSYTSAKKLQKNIENANQAINLFAKTVRTSKAVAYYIDGASTACNKDQTDQSNCTGTALEHDRIRVYDYSQSKCYAFEVNSSGSEKKFIIQASGVIDESGCLGNPLSETVTLVDIQYGNISIDKDIFDESRSGKVTLTLGVGQNTAANKDTDNVVLQTTVSMRKVREVAAAGGGGGTGGTGGTPSCSYTYSGWSVCVGGTKSQTYTPSDPSCTSPDQPLTATCDSSKPSTPINLIATPASNQVVLKWTASTDNVGVAGYSIFRNGSPIATSVTNSYTNSGLAANTDYKYKVSAYDAEGNISDVSSEITTRTLAAPDTQAPTIPLNLSSSALSSSQIKLSWTASTDNVAVSGYNIYRCQGASCTPTVKLTTSNTNSYTNSSLAASTSYTYKVSAYDAAGNESGFSNNSTATTWAAGSCSTWNAPNNWAQGGGSCDGKRGKNVVVPSGTTYSHLFPSGGGEADESYECINGAWTNYTGDGSSTRINYNVWQDSATGNLSYTMITCN